MKSVIVVGGGSAGSVVARRLLDAGATVTLLEAGRPDDNPDIHDLSRMPMLWHGPDDWAYFTTPQANALGRQIHWPRGRVLGGSHSLNACIFVRGAHGDYDRWEREGAEGWGWAEVLPWFQKMENFLDEGGGSDLRGHDGLLDVGTDYLHSPIQASLYEAAVQAGIPANPDYNGEHIEGVGWEQMTLRGRKRLSTFRAYLHDQLDNPRLTVRTGCWVHRLLVEDERVVGVVLEENDEVSELRADEVILCSGALDSPRVLMLSGIGPAEHLQEVGIEVVADLPGVGENLHDHLLVPVICTTEKPIDPPSEWVPVTQVHHFTTFREGSDVPDTQPLYFSVPMLGEGQQVEGSAFSLMAGLVRPTSRGTLRLASSDPHERALMDPNVLDTPEDLASLVASVRQCQEIARQAAVADEWGAVEVYPGPAADSDEGLVRYIREQVTTYHHQVGTCRMGTDELAVVDPHEFTLRGGPAGVRVIDASVMPSVPSGNTNAPTIMIAERGADAIIRSW